MSGGVVGAVAIATALGSALVAGIFFAFSVFIMAALRRLPAEQGIAAMQSINVTVLNPWFFAAFFGTGLGAVALAVLGLLQWGASGSVFLVAGGLLYPVGCIGVTIACNVPLNNALAAVEPDSPEGAKTWARYLATWTRWNHVRTAASLAAAAAFIIVVRS